MLRLLVLSLLIIPSILNASFINPPKTYARDLMVKVPGTDNYIAMDELAFMNAKALSRLTGHKMNKEQKSRFRQTQRALRNMIGKDGSIQTKKEKRGIFGGWSFHWGGFALGFLPVLGPIISLFFTDDYKWDRFWTAMHVNLVVLTLAVVLLTTSMDPFGN
jgi:hypothetical protein